MRRSRSKISSKVFSVLASTFLIVGCVPTPAIANLSDIADNVNEEIKTFNENSAANEVVASESKIPAAPVEESNVVAPSDAPEPQDPPKAEERRYTYRLIVQDANADQTIIRVEDTVLARYNGIVLLGFDNAGQLEEAKAYYKDKSPIVSVDGAVGVSSEDENLPDIDSAQSAEMTKPQSVENNPFAALEKTIKEEKEQEKAGVLENAAVRIQAMEVETTGQTEVDEKPLIALVDTGVYEDVTVKDRLSVLGGNGVDDNGHGTSMAQTIYGENPEAEVLSIKALDETGHGSASAVYAAIELAIEKNAKLINCSFAGPANEGNAIIEKAVKDALDHDVVVVAAAGNGGHDASKITPANIEGVFTVGAADNGEINTNSNKGECIDIYVESQSTSLATAQITAFASKNLLIDWRVAAASYFNCIANSNLTGDDNLKNSDIVNGVDAAAYTVSFYGADKYMGSQSFTGTANLKLLSSLSNKPNIAYSNSGWTFYGWATSKGTKARNYTDGQSITPTRNLTLYGIWYRNITLHWYNSSTATTPSSSTKVQYYYSASSGTSSVTKTSITTYPLYTNAYGWTPLGWSLSSANSVAPYPQTGSTTISITPEYSTRATNLYALYSRDVTLNYNANGGSGSIASVTKTQIFAAGDGSQQLGFQLATNTFTKANSQFDGWAAGSTSGTKYAEDQYFIYPVKEWNTSRSYTMYATWKATTVKVTFMNGSNLMGEQEVSIDVATNLTDVSSLTTTSCPQSTYGWNFAGWATSNSTSSVIYSNAGSITTSDPVTLHAVYQRQLTFKYYSSASATSISTSTPYQYYYGGSARAVSTYALYTQSSYSWAPLGWVTSTSSTSASVSQTGSTTTTVSPGTTAGRTYYALYSRTATLSYNSNGGSGTTTATTGTQRFVAGSGAQSLSLTLASNNFSKSGYGFSKWAAGSASGTQYSAGGSFTWPNTSWSSSASYTMYAIWAGNSYSVAFNNNGGSGSMTTQTGFTYGTSKSLSSCTFTAPTASGGGWYFAGWATSQTRSTAGTVDYSDGGSMSTGTTTSGGTVTLYAVWKRTVSFKSGSGAASTSSVTQLWNGSAGVAITSPANSSATAITGWDKLGWRNDTSAGASEVAFNTSFSSDATTYYAAYSRTATFYSGTSNGTSATATQYYNSYGNYSLTIPSAPATISSWTAQGWRTDTTAGDKTYNTTGTITGSAGTTLYAVYSRTLTLSYTNGGGTGTAPPSTTFVQKYNSNGSITSASFTLASNTFTRSGYTFNGWDVGAAGTSYTDWSPGVTNTTVTKSTAAQWTGVSYSVAFNNNGGSGSMTTQTGFVYGTDKALTSNGFSAPTASGGGWYFAGWATSQSRATEGTVDYANGANMTYGTTTSGGTVTLYAVWKRTIAFKSGSNSSLTTNVTQLWNGSAGVAITSPSQATAADITGYSELGWRGNTTASTADVSYSTSFSPSVTTYYAAYSRNVTFYHGYNQSYSTTVTQYYNSTNAWSCTTPSADACTDLAGWTELGWREDSTATSSSYNFASTCSSSSSAFYAVYRRSGTVNYNANGGEGTTNPTGTGYQYLSSYDQTLSPASISSTLANNGFIRAGYIFDRWNLGAEGASYTWSPAYNATSTSVTADAQWRGVSYSVAFDANGGSGTMSTQTGFTYGTGKTLDTHTFTPPTASGGGWYFAGWATSQSGATSGTVDYADGADVTYGTTTSGGTVTLYAVWKRDIAFKSGTNMETTEIVTQRWNGTAGVNITTPASTNCTAVSGFNTLGWRSDTSAEAASLGCGTSFSPSTTTYYAVYSRDVSFYYGYNHSGVISTTQYYNTANVWSCLTPSASMISDLSGWNEDGWRADTSAAASEYGFGVTCGSSSGTFYAVYSREGTIIYDANGGTGTVEATPSNTQYLSSYSSVLSPASLSATLAPNSFSKDGYVFNGWDVGAPLTTHTWTPAYHSSTADTTATAQWRGAGYSVTFYPNGGSGSSYVQSGFVYGTPTALDPKTFTAPTGGYEFTGWATSVERAQAGNIDYTDEQSVSDLVTDDNGNKDLYAVWKKTITINSGEEMSHSEDKDVFFGGEVDTSSSVEDIDGWTFEGWRSDDTSGFPMYTETSFDPGSADSLNAVYSRTATLRYASGDPSVQGVDPDPVEETQYYNATGAVSIVSVTLASNPYSRDGYEFLGWSLGDEGQVYSWAPGVEEATDVVAVAEWAASLPAPTGFTLVTSAFPLSAAASVLLVVAAALVARKRRAGQIASVLRALSQFESFSSK